MKLTHIQVDGFRNLQEIDFLPSPHINVIFGENAQGKTNLIESIWMFTGQKSFRMNRESEVIGFDRERADLQIEFEDQERKQKAKIRLSKKKNDFFLNRVPQKSARGYSGHFYAVIFTPAHLKIVQEAPLYRRRFLNQGISQLRKDYASYYLQYERILHQRNSFLKDRSGSDSMLDIWDMQLAKVGTILTLLRADYTAKLNRASQSIFEELTQGKEKMNISYQSTVFDTIEDVSYNQEKIERYYKEMKKRRNKDQEYKTTGIGVHRDDLEITVNGLSLKNYGSQGQQRSCVIACKLGEAKLIQELTKEYPIVLLDDVMSELDIRRQQYILNYIKDYQVFITCCFYKDIEKEENGKKICMKKGKIVS